ncbi:leucyl aminopeptidase [Brevibacillus laterosporus]|uniref:leucyl aminopeptidase n=1 Tax=Brevibacillus laterosporus TaxID=1465 RepID=UPI000BD971CB|nr:leucyl aminopeptidase [Brevibacillus laterosporus]PCN42790.1 leucyl aminopeptidase [Brevibacillus laterosporus]
MIHIEAKNPSYLEKRIDYFILPVYRNQTLHTQEWSELDATFHQQLSQMLQTGEISDQKGKVTILHTLGQLTATRLVFLGMGEMAELDFISARDAFAKAVQQLKTEASGKSLAILLTEQTNLGPERLTQAVGEAFLLGTYAYEGYRAIPKHKPSFQTVEIVVHEEQEAKAETGLQLAQAFSTGTNLARTLVNEPGNYLPPHELANRAIEVAKRYGMSYELLAKDKLEELNMGGVLSVAQGSAELPYVVVIKYQGKEQWEDVIGLIGKGVTFDTGGISIKPVAGMEEMKTDMGGSAAMIGAMEAIGRLQPAVNIMMVIGCVENMPSGTAYKPGDVITTMSGKTVEIITTDAEGRLVLADCITYAKQQGVSCLVDCATLTGGIVVALGHVATGLMTNNQQLANEMLQAAQYCGERLWQLPTFPEYRELNKSHVADLKNSGGRYGHAIIAGVFLQEFAEETPWVHVDIAGTASQSKTTPLGPIGATGAMVRSIAQFLLQRAN